MFVLYFGGWGANAMPLPPEALDPGVQNPDSGGWGANAMPPPLGP